MSGPVHERDQAEHQPDGERGHDEEQPRELSPHAASQASDKGGVQGILGRTSASREFGQATATGQVERAPKAPEPPGIGYAAGVAGTLSHRNPLVWED
ncbi:MAG: hypothetical protein M3198_19540 [Actinomycetota bacterium]|nr:hypothetical protein [Actinomycetota bacterium]